MLDFFPILRAKLRSPARDLSGGQQQMLALAQAFVARPAVLLCDEPSLGLAQALIPPILEFLKNWARDGVAVLIVEQQIDLALSIADRALVLERGAITLAGKRAGAEGRRRACRRSISARCGRDADAISVAVAERQRLDPQLAVLLDEQQHRACRDAGSRRRSRRSRNERCTSLPSAR